MDENGNVVIPPIVQDATDTFLHNFAYAMNAQIGENECPKKYLLIGTAKNRVIDTPHSVDPYYSHELIKKVVLDPDFVPDGLPVKKEFTYGNVTVYYLAEADLDESSGIVLSNDVQYTNLQGTKGG
jgi:hypothetical protein